MRIIHFRIAAAAACLLAACTGISMGAARSIPLIENFNDYNSAGELLGASTGWSTNQPDGIVGVTNVCVEGTKAGYTSLADLSLAIANNAAYSNVWCRLAVAPTLYDDTAPPSKPGTDVSVAFYIAQSNHMVKYAPVSDGQAWSNIATVGSSTWYTFIVHTDYKNKQWDLYVSEGTDYLQPCTRLNSTPLPFNNGFGNDKTLTNLTIEGVAKLDAIAMARDHSRVLVAGDNRTNVIVRTTAIPAGLVAQISLPTEAYASGGSGSEDSLGGLLGDDLLAWTDAGDLLKVRTLGGSSPDHTYAATADPGWDDTLAAGLLADDAHVTPGTGLWLTKSGGGLLVCFSDYNTARTGEDKTVYGTGSQLVGWNHLAWTKTTQSNPVNPDGFGFTGAGTGDTIYLRWNGKMRRLFRSADGKWIDGSAPSSAYLQPGQAFWYFRNGGNITWDVDAAQ